MYIFIYVRLNIDLQVRNSQFAAFINTFTTNTYVMVIQSDPMMPSEAALVNIRNAKKYFEELENPHNNMVHPFQ